MGYKIVTETEVNEAYCVTYTYDAGDPRDPPSNGVNYFLTEEEARVFIREHVKNPLYSNWELYKKTYLPVLNPKTFQY